MTTTEILKNVRKIEIKTRGMVNQIFSGEYHSVFKGRGMNFSEVREYQYGDDIRSIDWNVSARYNHPYIKVYEEERELTVMLIVDFSRSGNFGTVEKFKNEIAAELCAVLAFSALKNNDKVGMILFTDIIEKFIPPKKGKSHALRLIRELLAFQPKNSGTNISLALENLTHVMKRRCIAFVISDFFDDGFEKAMQLASRKHDVIALLLSDPKEQDIPKIGLVKFRDAETGIDRWVDTNSRTVREMFARYFQQLRERQKQIFLKSRVDAVPIRIDQSYITPLVNFFRMREGRA
ncbi:MAG: DUF58 domain-containing protein [Ignavibacteria bacterium]|nr:DUF58 domain-containing protein [Ignavibacteria bacterium]